LPEERGHREPIGQPPYKGGFGSRPNKQDPESRLRRQGGKNEQRRHRREQYRRNNAISAKAAPLKILRAYRHAGPMPGTEDILNIGWARYHLHCASLSR
jgi:hypothetical protein